MLSTHGLSKYYGSRPALRDVALNVARGSVYGLVGRNGAGKTTLLSILAGLRRPDSGTVQLGVDRSRTAVCPDVPSFEPWLTALEVLELAGSLTGVRPSRAELLTRLADAGLAAQADSRVGGFSRGMTQRLALAATFLGGPDLVLLDEPCSALDPAGRAEVLDLIARLAHRTTVVFSTHILADVERVCDSVGVLDAGRLVYQGSLPDLLNSRHRPVWDIRIRGDAGPVVAQLRDRPWAADVRQTARDRIRLEATGATAAGPELIASLARARADVIALEPRAADLETVFLALTAPTAPTTPTVPAGTDRHSAGPDDAEPTR